MFLPFQYHDPKTFEAFLSLASSQEKYEVMAGGTDLLVKMRNGWQHCDCVIDIKKIEDLPEMKEIRQEESGILLGALVDFTRIKEHPVIREKFASLHEASCVMGCFEIRNRATIGGNICTAGAGAEGGSSMLVLEALVNVIGKNGRRQVPLDRFYRTITRPDGSQKARVDLERGELVSSFFLPYLPGEGASAYARRARTKGMDVAGINLSLAVVRKAHGLCEVRIAAGAVATVPIRFPEIEKKIVRYPIPPELLEALKTQLSQSISPRASSKRASPAYKKDQIGHLLEVCLQKLGLTTE